MIERSKISQIPPQLLALVADQDQQALPEGIELLSDAARSRHGEAVRAVLFYGSCLRNGNIYDGLVDLYLLVDDYRAAFGSRGLAALNRWMPPNVFYLEVPGPQGLLRAKYAVLTLDHFRRGMEHWFHSYLWGRFCQKAGIIYAADAGVVQHVWESFAAAVVTFVARTLPQMEPVFTARDLWVKGLSLSYRSELRTEKPERSKRLFDADPGYYQALTQAILSTNPVITSVRKDDEPVAYQVQISRRSHRLNSLAWRLRAAQGKVLSVLRLLKASLTFQGGVNYILWKIERHSGVHVEVPPRLRRVPPLALIVILWRLYRKDAIR